MANDQLIDSVTAKMVNALKQPNEYSAKLNPKMANDAVFASNIRQLVATLPEDSLTELNKDKVKNKSGAEVDNRQAAELAKSLGRAIASTGAQEEALFNFENLDKSKYVKNGMSVANDIATSLSKMKDLNAALKPGMHITTPLSTKLLDKELEANKDKITAIAAGMIAGVVAKQSGFLGFGEKNPFAADLNNKSIKDNNKIGFKVLIGIHDAAVELAATPVFQSLTAEQALLKGKEIGISVRDHLHKNQAALNLKDHIIGVAAIAPKAPQQVAQNQPVPVADGHTEFLAGKFAEKFGANKPNIAAIKPSAKYVEKAEAQSAQSAQR